MLVVPDTSPLNYLVWIDAVDVLRLLYGCITIPPEAWAHDLPDWVEVCPPDPGLRDDPRWRFLDLGERAALALALAQQPPAILLIDERTGAAVAREQGLPVVGTLGVLDEAARRQHISLPEVIERLKRTSFRYPKKIVSRLLEEDALRRRGR